MTEAKNRQDAKDVLTHYLESKHLRKTPERYAILDKVFEMGRRFDINKLSESMESSSYHVCKATLYNVLQLFTDAGLLVKQQFDGKNAHYERVIGNTSINYLHLVCKQCGKIKDVKSPESLNELTKIKFRMFHTEYVQTYVYGICSTCMRKNKKTITN